MWPHLNQTIYALVNDGVHQMHQCDGTDKQALAYAFFKDMGYDVTELTTDNNLLDAMEATPSVETGLLVFWQTIAPLDYDELLKRYLVDDFEAQLANVCEDLFNDHVAQYLRDDEAIHHYTSHTPWWQERLA